MEKEKTKPTVKKIVLQVRDKEIVLSMEEAKELRRVLDELFGEKVVLYKHNWTYWDWISPRSPQPTWYTQKPFLLPELADQIADINSVTLSLKS